MSDNQESKKLSGKLTLKTPLSLNQNQSGKARTIVVEKRRKKVTREEVEAGLEHLTEQERDIREKIVQQALLTNTQVDSLVTNEENQESLDFSIQEEEQLEASSPLVTQSEPIINIDSTSSPSVEEVKQQPSPQDALSEEQKIFLNNLRIQKQVRESNKSSSVQAPATQQPKSNSGVVRSPASTQSQTSSTVSVGLTKSKKVEWSEEEAHKDSFSSKESKHKNNKQILMRSLQDDDSTYRRFGGKNKKKNKEVEDTKVKIVREVIIPDTITVQELANRMSEKASNVIRELMRMNVMATINSVIDSDVAELIVETLGHSFKRADESAILLNNFNELDKNNLQSRPPVITIMGHVDHGKTSLLDALRKTNVVSGEAGGITQHIGAYQITTNKGNKLTFIDTPGHEAFSSMRARGAKVTDIVILVVAGDDGVMPQTVEAINHAKAAGVPIIVAINKMDKPNSDPTRIRTELLKYELVVESLSGDILEVEISAKTGMNLDKLLETIELQAEVMNLQANFNRQADGVVIESELDKGRGAVATVLVKGGTLKVGDVMVAGTEWGKVRALLNDKGESIAIAGVSMPVQVLGLSGVPSAGSDVAVVNDESKAREMAEYRQRKLKEKIFSSKNKTFNELIANIQNSNAVEIGIVVKGDVHGSVETIVHALERITNENIRITVLHFGVGGITETDIDLAAASNGLVIGFNVRPNKQARELANKLGVEIKHYSIIYELLDDIKAVLSGKLEPDVKETLVGKMEVKESFTVSKTIHVAGGVVTFGSLLKTGKVRIVREGEVLINKSTITSLKRFKDEVKEVSIGQDCGLSVDRYNDIKKGDIIECFTEEFIPKKI